MSDKQPSPQAADGSQPEFLVAQLEELVGEQKPHIREHTVVQVALAARMDDLRSEQRWRRAKVEAMLEVRKGLGAEAAKATLESARKPGVRVFGRVARIMALATNQDEEGSRRIHRLMESLGRAKLGARMLIEIDGELFGTRLISRRIEVSGNNIAVRVERTSAHGPAAFSYYPGESSRSRDGSQFLAVGRPQIEAYVEATWPQNSLARNVSLMDALAELDMNVADIIEPQELAKLEQRLLVLFSDYNWPPLNYNTALDVLAKLNGRTPTDLSALVRRAIVDGIKLPMAGLLGAGGPQLRAKVASLLCHEGKLKPDRDVTLHPLVAEEVARLEKLAAASVKN